MATPRTIEERELLLAQDREANGFTARTLIDDIIGKLMFMRDRMWLEIPAEAVSHLHDLEARVERDLIPIAEALPESPIYQYDLKSDSKCFSEGCSCGMPMWGWSPPDSP